MKILANFTFGDEGDTKILANLTFANEGFAMILQNHRRRWFYDGFLRREPSVTKVARRIWQILPSLTKIIQNPHSRSFKK